LLFHQDLVDLEVISNSAYRKAFFINYMRLKSNGDYDIMDLSKRKIVLLFFLDEKSVRCKKIDVTIYKKKSM